MLAWLRCKVKVLRNALVDSSASFAGLGSNSLTIYVVGLLGEYLSEGWTKRLADSCHVSLGMSTLLLVSHQAYTDLLTSLSGTLLPLLARGNLVWYRLNAGKMIEGLQIMVWCMLYQSEPQQSSVTGNRAANAFPVHLHCNLMHECRAHSVPGPGM